MVTVIKEGSKGSSIQKLLNSIKSKKGLRAKKHSGVLKLKKNPLTIQKEMRNEWS